MRRTPYAPLALATVGTTLLLIAAGGFVRAMEAGLGCPDWPTCHGSLNPPSSLKVGALKLAWIEHSHRLLAAVVVALIVALAVAVHLRERRRRVRVAALVLVPAVLSQAVIGAFVVWLKLDASAVVLHLGGALAVLSLALYVALHATGWDAGTGGTTLPPVRLATAAAGVTVVQMLLGSAVTGWSAGLAYGTFPSFAGHVLPPVVRTPQQWLHVTHRFLAVGVAALVAAVWWRARAHGDPRLRAATTAAIVLTGVQVGLGAANIWYRLPAWSVTAHLAVGSWLVAALVVAAYRARWLAAPGPVAVGEVPELAAAT